MEKGGGANSSRLLLLLGRPCPPGGIAASWGRGKYKKKKSPASRGREVEQNLPEHRHRTRSALDRLIEKKRRRREVNRLLPN